MKNTVSIVFLVIGAMSWIWPGFNGIFRASSQISPEAGQIVGAILLVGAAVLWFMPTSEA